MVVMVALHCECTKNGQFYFVSIQPQFQKLQQNKYKKRKISKGRQPHTQLLTPIPHWHQLQSWHFSVCLSSLVRDPPKEVWLPEQTDRVAGLFLICCYRTELWRGSSNGPPCLLPILRKWTPFLFPLLFYAIPAPNSQGWLVGGLESIFIIFRLTSVWPR